jgi:glycerate 2-kinase
VRILVATDAIGALPSRQAGELIASGWRPSADVWVLPVGEAGGGFIPAYADLADVTISSERVDGLVVTTGAASNIGLVRVLDSVRDTGIPIERTSRPLGQAIARVVRQHAPAQLAVDLAGLRVHDAGAGLLAALGASGDRPLDRGVDELHGLSQFDLAPARALLGETELIGVVPAAERDQLLLGLRGITARAGREANSDPELMLRTDATLEAFVRLADASKELVRGAGACGGLGFAVLALGGRLTTGPALALASDAGQATRHGMDLVVTGCSVFDFASRGGGVVAAIADAASASLSPCIVIAGEVLIGSREMRTMGIEAGYAVRESTSDVPAGEVSAEELAETARRVARSWSW